MGMRALQSLAKSSRQERGRERHFVRHLVFGGDLFALEAYRRLVERYGESEVALLFTRPWKVASREDFLREFLPWGPSLLRGEENIAYLREHAPQMEMYSSNESCFFKEGQLRSFGGRAKSEALLHGPLGEEFFTQTPLQVIGPDEYAHLFSILRPENEEWLLTELPKKMLSALPLRLLPTVPDDLVEGANWRLEAASGADYACEKIYFADGAETFLDLLNEKEKFSNEFFNLLERARGPATFYYRLEFSKNLTPSSATHFIPLSFTHEWGHFMGEFYALGESKVQADFCSFVSREQTNEEELAKKLRLFKKNLEKIFPEMNSYLTAEWLKLSPLSMCQNIDDQQWDKLFELHAKLAFIGANAPIPAVLANRGDEEKNVKYSREKLSHLVRAHASLSSLVSETKKN